MLYFVKQALWFLAFVLGVVGFFAGVLIATPAFGLLVMLPSIEYTRTGIWHAPGDYAQMAAVLAIGLVILIVGIAFLGTSLTRMSLALNRVVFSGTFVVFGLFFGWSLYTFYPTMRENGHTDGIIIMSIMILACALASFVPFLPDDHRIQSPRHRW